MSVIRQSFILEGSRGGRRVKVLVDSASSECLIQPDLSRELGLIDETPEPLTMHTAKKDIRFGPEGGLVIFDFRFAILDWGLMELPNRKSKIQNPIMHSSLRSE